MLGSTARKLRAFGFDTTYFRGRDDLVLLASAKKENRIVLTADRSLAARAGALGSKALLLVGETEGERLGAIKTMTESAGTRLVRGPPRCSLCNSRLQALPRSEVVGRIPGSIAARHRLFFRCVACGKYYWRGGHWKKLRWLSRRLGAVPNDNVRRRR